MPAYQDRDGTTPATKDGDPVALAILTTGGPPGLGPDGVCRCPCHLPGVARLHVAPCCEPWDGVDDVLTLPHVVPAGGA